jgi:hypothetical protein
MGEIIPIGSTKRERTQSRLSTEFSHRVVAEMDKACKAGAEKDMVIETLFRTVLKALDATPHKKEFLYLWLEKIEKEIKQC